MRRVLAIAAAAVLLSTGGAAVAAAVPVHAPTLRAPAGAFQELYVPSTMGPVKIQVRWAKRGGSAALYVLDGFRAPNDHSQWLTDTNILHQFANDDVTLVFPVGGRSSFYTDWYRPSRTNGQRTTYRWETFLTRELPAFLAGYGVSRSNNGIVGISMGGNAALTLAGRHRNQFRFAGSFSGFVNPTFPAWDTGMRLAMWDEGNFNPDDMWGPRSDPAWARNDATVQAAALRGLPVYVTAGNGSPGVLDLQYGAVNTLNAMGLETMAMIAAQLFRDRAVALRLPARVDILPGTHNWPYWQLAMTRAHPMILNALNIR
ncbi:MAG: esterase family protein [Mycobacteriaceae bacterium]|nr:esterase family protein [Mycobacteriaceae bacterium]